jgi:hypothetical protein
MVISQVTEHRPERIKSLVYLTAFLPLDGQVGFDVLDPNSQVPANMIINEDVAMVVPRLQGEPHRPYLEAVHLTAQNFGRVPRYSIECLQDRVITPTYAQQLYTQTPCQQVFSLNTSHSPFISAPADLAKILLSFA